MRIPVFFLLMAILMLNACAPPAKRPFPTSTLAAVRAELASGRAEAALQRIHRSIKKGSPENLFAAEYPLAINGAVAAAEKYRQAQQYEAAGEIFSLVLAAWPRTPEVAARLGCSAASVQADRRHCADRLMEMGLREYREGRLEDAIVWWEKTLQIDSSHAAARQAIETASMQLRNLRALQ